MASAISASQSIVNLLPSDAQLGVDQPSLDDAADDLIRFAAQADSVSARWCYQAIGSGFQFGRNVMTPFQETRAELDRMVRQFESPIKGGAVRVLGAGFGFGSEAYALPNALLMGTVDAVTDPVGMLAQIPDAIEHSGNAIFLGARMLVSGHVSEGTALLTQGLFGDWMIVQGMRMAIKLSPVLYGAYAGAVNSLPRPTRSMSLSCDPVSAWMAHPERGSVVLSGMYNGRKLSPFRMKTTPVTNGEWRMGLKGCGDNRYIDVVFDNTTGAIEIRNVTAHLPRGIHPSVDLDAGQVFLMGPRALLKMVDNPSRYYDGVARSYRFGVWDHPVVNVTPLHAKVWLELQTQATGGYRRYRLPTDLEFEAAASNFGSTNFGLYHSICVNRGFSTAPVDAMPVGPLGVQLTGNVWSWTEFNPGETQPFGYRGGAWTEFNPTVFRADYRAGASNPGYRRNDIGLRVAIDETP